MDTHLIHYVFMDVNTGPNTVSLQLGLHKVLELI